MIKIRKINFNKRFEPYKRTLYGYELKNINIEDFNYWYKNVYLPHLQNKCSNLDYLIVEFLYWYENISVLHLG